LRIDIRLDVHANAWSQYDKWTTLEESQTIESNDQEPNTITHG
jgi:hypothetical protein